MNVTFLIGNGFDLGVGLKSRFSDFFPEYKKRSAKKEKRIKALSQNIAGDYGNWANFENMLGEYTLEFTDKTKQDFLDQIRDFEREFNDYLKEQEEGLFFDNAEEIAETMRSGLCNFYSSDILPIASHNALRKKFTNHQDENCIYKFIVFNYTSVFEKCINLIPNGVVRTRRTSFGEKIDSIKSVVYVHGRIGDYPLMGVNDVSQIKNQELAKDKRFVQYIVKPLLNSAHRLERDANATHIIQESSVVCIYGMSLGKTDKKWWQLIVQWLKASPSRQLVVFLHDQGFSANDQFGRIEKENELIDKLAGYASGVNVEALRPRIHLAINKNIFERKINHYFGHLFHLMNEQKDQKEEVTV